MIGHRMESTPPELHFDAVLRVLDGQRVPLNAGASKLLRFMLERPEGCDAFIEPGRFEIRFGWHPARHRYFPNLATVVLGFLLDRITLSGGAAADLRGVVGPAAVSTQGFDDWSFDARRVWILRGDGRVTVMIRSLAASVGEAAREALPEPIDFPPPRSVELSKPYKCRTCGQSGSRFRDISGGYFVCGNCGCSFSERDREA